MCVVFANGPVDQGSVPGHVIPKTLKMVIGHTAAALWGAASMTCAILLAAFLCSCCQAFSPAILLASM